MAGLIVEDTRQQEGRHDVKHGWWSSHGVDVVRHKLETGDYMAPGSSATVDTKASLLELAMDLGRDHRRFRAELERARDAGLSMVVLTEVPVTLDDVARWPGYCQDCPLYAARRCHPSVGRCPRFRRVPMQGSTMARQMRTMAGRYGCRFMFCDPGESARTVCDLLGVPYKS